MSNITFTCPSGGKWYTCSSGSKFVGCCGTDPCSSGCKQGDIQPAAFPFADFGTFPDASCESGSDFFTCAPSAESTFWGCCKSNPCSNTPAATCKQGDLTPAFLGRPEQLSGYVGEGEDGKSSSNGAIIGGAIGGGLGAAIIIGVLIFFYCRRKKRNQKVAHPEETGATASTPMMKDGFQDNNRLSTQYGQSPPPTYSSPDPNFYQSMSPAKGNPYQPTQHTYGHEGAAPVEMPAELASPAQNRYSELPAEATSSRYSELPAGAAQATAELESPQTSPRPMQTEFSSDMAKHANSSTGEERK